MIPSFAKCARVEFPQATGTAEEGPGYHCRYTDASRSRVLSYISPPTPFNKGPGVVLLHESDGGQKLERCQCRIYNRNAPLHGAGSAVPLCAQKAQHHATQDETQSKSELGCLRLGCIQHRQRDGLLRRNTDNASLGPAFSHPSGLLEHITASEPNHYTVEKSVLHGRAPPFLTERCWHPG